MKCQSLSICWRNLFLIHEILLHFFLSNAVVKVTVLLQDIKMFSDMNKIYGECKQMLNLKSAPGQ
jgi:enamine deaminase RidA (YjgF/YER057c/UK114 family)